MIPGSKEKAGEYNLNRNEKQWDPIFHCEGILSKRRADNTSFQNQVWLSHYTNGKQGRR
jgi:hypothetical protein